MFQNMVNPVGGSGGSITYQSVTVTSTPVTIKIKNGVYYNNYPSSYNCYCIGYVIDGVNTIIKQAPAFTVSYNTTTNELTMSTNASYVMEFFIIE